MATFHLSDIFLPTFIFRHFFFFKKKPSMKQLYFPPKNDCNSQIDSIFTSLFIASHRNVSAEANASMDLLQVYKEIKTKQQRSGLRNLSSNWVLVALTVFYLIDRTVRCSTHFLKRGASKSSKGWVTLTLCTDIIRSLASKHTLVFPGYTKIYKINRRKSQSILMLKVISL